MNQIHVVPHNDGWDVKKDGAQRASNHFEKKEDAVARAREIARNEELELVVHNRDGEVGSRKDSHGPDRNPPRG